MMNYAQDEDIVFPPHVEDAKGKDPKIGATDLS
jgi:hypothetical protein